MIVGGAAIPESTIRAFDERHGLHLVHAWGMTETSPLGSISRRSRPSLRSAPPDDQYAWRATQGRPAPMVEIRARSDAGLVAWDGATMGELEVRGPWVAAAYYPGDVAVDRWTEDGWFRTGDIVTIAPTGCVTIQDRAKDLVKSGGEWISTVALESALVGHPAGERGRRGRGAASAVGRAAAGGDRARHGVSADDRGTARAPGARTSRSGGCPTQWSASSACRRRPPASTRSTKCARCSCRAHCRRSSQSSASETQELNRRSGQEIFFGFPESSSVRLLNSCLS